MILHLKGKQTYSEIIRACITQKVNASQIAFEIRVLQQVNLIYKGSRFGLYDLTDSGRNALDLAIQLSKIMKNLEDRDEYNDIPACLKILPPMEIR